MWGEFGWEGCIRIVVATVEADRAGAMSDTTHRISPSEVTPRELYLNRRSFMRAGLVAAAAAGSGLLYRRLNGVELDAGEMPALTGLVTAPRTGGYWVDEAPTPRASILNYN